MIPRSQLDIGWSDLINAAVHSAAPHDHAAGLAASWPPDGHSILCLSVRTGFDLLLRTLALPAGSEVLMSAITIADMGRIARAHGLIPVPVDIDPDTLAPDPQSLATACSAASRVLVLAHLFGAECDFSTALEFARRNDLFVIEDCAQSYDGGRFVGHEDSDARLFSFGPIKTQTALGGAILSCRDPDMLVRVAAVYRKDPVQADRIFARRVLRFSMLRLLGRRTFYSVFTSACRLAGRNHDDILNGATRGFPGADLITQLRKRPSPPLIAFLRHRLSNASPTRIAVREQCGEAFRAMLDPHVHTPGSSNRRHTYWLFPVCVDDPGTMMRALWSAGFDATRGQTSLTTIEPPAERPDVVPVRAVAMMRQLLFLPVYPGISRTALLRLANIVSGRAGG